jgi:hypothetical protein
MYRNAFVFAAAFTLAACADSPTAPALAPTDAPSAGLVVIGGGSIPRLTPVDLTLVIDGQDGSAGVPGTTVKFTSSTGATMTVPDNSAADKDARDGYYRVAMTTANSYTAIVTGAAPHWSLAGATKTVSAFVNPNLVQMGALWLNRMPGIYVQLFYDNALAKSQTIKVTGPNGFARTMVDGGMNDTNFDGTQNGNDGTFSLEVPETGTYQVCAMTTPQSLWDAGCSPVYALQYFIQYGVKLTYAQQWVIPKFP